MRTIDLSDKLGLEGRPTIVINGAVLTVNDSAQNMMLILEELGDGELTYQGAFKAAKLLFEPQSAKALAKLNLNLDDYITVVTAALDLVTGGGEGEAGTPDTTS